MTSKGFVLFSVLFLAACSTTETVVQYPSVCLPDDYVCERNQNAKTLDALGYGDAALELMCQDPAVRDVLRECDVSAGYSW